MLLPRESATQRHRMGDFAAGLLLKWDLWLRMDNSYDQRCATKCLRLPTPPTKLPTGYCSDDLQPSSDGPHSKSDVHPSSDVLRPKSDRLITVDVDMLCFTPFTSQERNWYAALNCSVPERVSAGSFSMNEHPLRLELRAQQKNPRTPHVLQLCLEANSCSLTSTATCSSWLCHVARIPNS